ncbi:hypothetical protein ACHHYP_00207 [Achlya hypogyna]|uniref:Uncharacterized protein n=1 Tax=Achlya hypogyna TaxID=1202772 RepID=A0A1V9ZBA5_ACHHY|nr:hypothetical protein ACHHYP_00207 [Achlya hypogyna]
MSCCEGGHHSHSHVEGYDIEGDDPTLSACCLKDKKEQAHVARVMSVLRREDVTAKRLEQRHMTHNSGFPQAPAAVAMTSVDPDEISDDDDDEYAYLMDDESIVGGLEHQRRAALQARAALRAQGLGILWGDAEFQVYRRHVSSLDTQALIAAKHNRPTVVARVPADEAANTLISVALVAGAERYLGTCFFGISAACDELLAATCRRSVAGPVLVALSSHGEYIAHKSLASFREEDWDATLLPWLAKCNVLREEFSQPATTATAPSAEDDEEAERTGYDCGHDGCRLKYGYYHEHVGASLETKRDIAAWRQ